MIGFGYVTALTVLAHAAGSGTAPAPRNGSAIDGARPVDYRKYVQRKRPLRQFRRRMELKTLKTLSIAGALLLCCVVFSGTASGQAVQKQYVADFGAAFTQATVTKAQRGMLGLDLSVGKDAHEQPLRGSRDRL